MSNKYMHLMDGKPAAFDQDGQYMYFATRAIKTSEMASSLKQIRREQKISRQNDLRRTFPVGHEYSYILVKHDEL